MDSADKRISPRALILPNVGLVLLTGALVFTMIKLHLSNDKVERLEKKLELCKEEKDALVADTTALRSHANNSFEAMSIFLERLIVQGDGEWVAERLGLGSVSKQEGRSRIMHYHAEDMGQ
jgi:hypothetical protein